MSVWLRDQSSVMTEAPALVRDWRRVVTRVAATITVVYLIHGALRGQWGVSAFAKRVMASVASPFTCDNYADLFTDPPLPAERAFYDFGADYLHLARCAFKESINASESASTVRPNRLSSGTYEMIVE